MALVERRYKNTVTYWIAVQQGGMSVWVNGGHSKAAARDLHDRLATAGREHRLATARDCTMSALVERYLADGTHHLRPQTVSTYESRLNNHILPFFGAMKVRRSCSTEAIQRWISFQRHKKVSDKTIRRCLVTLSAVMSYAVSINLVSVNPCSKVKPPRVDRGAVGVDYSLSAEEVALVVKNTPKGNDRVLMSFLFLTGCRPSEACELRFGDVDSHSCRVTIARTATKSGQNGTKNGAVRVVPLTGSHLAELLEQRRVLNAGADDLIFPTARGKRRDMQRFARDVLRPALTRAGLRVPEGSAVNYLARKTCISLLISQGVSPVLVSGIVGSSAAQILKTYTKVREEDTIAAMSALEASVALSESTDRVAV